MDAFNTCNIIDSEDFYIFSFNTLINLGPIQSLLNRKYTPKANDTAQTTHDNEIYAEIYRQNKAKKVISKVKDRNQAALVRAAEEDAIKAFNNGHVGCVHCVRNMGGGQGEGETEIGSN